MHLTDTFASTAALTIPVLMLAGTVELRNLTSAVERLTLRSYIDTFADLVEAYVAMYTSSRIFRLDVMWKIFRLFYKQGQISGFAIALPTAWGLVLLYSAIIEIICFVDLGGVVLSSQGGFAGACIISIGLLLVMLVLTPIVQVMFLATRAAIGDFDSKNKGLVDQVVREFGDIGKFRALSMKEKQAKIERARSLVQKIEHDQEIPDRRQLNSVTYTTRVMRSERKKPRWVNQSRGKTRQAKSRYEIERGSHRPRVKIRGENL
jgi:hypothetical protein